MTRLIHRPNETNSIGRGCMRRGLHLSHVRAIHARAVRISRINTIRRSALNVMNYPIAVLTLKRGSLTHGHADRSKEGLWMIELGQPRDKSPDDTSNCCHDSTSSQVIAPSMRSLYRQVSVAGVVLVTVSELTLNTGRVLHRARVLPRHRRRTARIRLRGIVGPSSSPSGTG